jgi:hypothetical protein
MVKVKAKGKQKKKQTSKYRLNTNNVLLICRKIKDKELHGFSKILKMVRVIC